MLQKNGKGNPWRRQGHAVGPQNIPQDILAFTKRRGWGERVTDLEIMHISPKVQQALAPGKIDEPGGLLDDLCKTYHSELNKGFYEELARPSNFDRERNPPPLHIEMRVEVIGADKVAARNRTRRPALADLASRCVALTDEEGVRPQRALQAAVRLASGGGG